MNSDGGRSKKYTREDKVRALQESAEEIDGRISKYRYEEWRKDTEGDYPSARTIYGAHDDDFDSWSDATREAGARSGFAGRKGIEIDPDALRKAREAAGLSRQELAAELDVSRQSIGRWERGESRADPEYADRLQEWLDDIERGSRRDE